VFKNWIFSSGCCQSLFPLSDVRLVGVGIGRVGDEAIFILIFIGLLVGPPTLTDLDKMTTGQKQGDQMMG
jgi:hypothetical protein